MPLNKDTLSASLNTLFTNAEAQNWDKARVASEMAAAIDAYVRAADVVNVSVEVRSPSNVVLGTGTQTAPGKVS